MRQEYAVEAIWLVNFAIYILYVDSMKRVHYMYVNFTQIII